MSQAAGSLDVLSKQRSSLWQLVRRDPSMVWTPAAVALAAVFGALAGWAAPAPNHDLGFAGTPTWLRGFILTDLTVIISVWVGIINNLNLKAYGFQMLLPVSHSQL